MARAKAPPIWRAMKPCANPASKPAPPPSCASTPGRRPASRSVTGNAPAWPIARPCRARGWQIVRRPSGGGALLHADELTYCLILPPGHPLQRGDIRASYRRLRRGLVAGLARLGIKADSCHRWPGGLPQPASARSRGHLLPAAGRLRSLRRRPQAHRQRPAAPPPLPAPAWQPAADGRYRDHRRCPGLRARSRAPGRSRAVAPPRHLAGRPARRSAALGRSGAGPGRGLCGGFRDSLASGFAQRRRRTARARTGSGPLWRRRLDRAALMALPAAVPDEI